MSMPVWPGWNRWVTPIFGGWSGIGHSSFGRLRVVTVTDGVPVGEGVGDGDADGEATGDSVGFTSGAEVDTSDVSMAAGVDVAVGDGRGTGADTCAAETDTGAGSAAPAWRGAGINRR